MTGPVPIDFGLGLPAEIWLLLTVLSCLAFFFKFQRFWSIRNLDLLLLFSLTPGMVQLVGRGAAQPWTAFVILFLGTTVWVVRSIIDLGLTRRPMLDPNLNASGLTCFVAGLLAMVIIETMILSEPGARARNPGDPNARTGNLEDPPNLGERPARSPVESDAPLGSGRAEGMVADVLDRAPPPSMLKRLCAAWGHLAIALGLVAIGWQHFQRTEIGLAMACAYLMLPYTRLALIDSGQLVPAGLVVLAVLGFRHPLRVGLALGFAAGWMPACLGLVPLWAGAYARESRLRFLAGALGMLLPLVILGRTIPLLANWGHALGARSLTEAGLLLTSNAPRTGSFWTGVDPAYRLPVIVAYIALVVVCTLWPAGKDLGQLIALSTTLLVSSQFWYLEEGGTLVVLYLPLVLLMVFRPNLASRVPPGTLPRRPPRLERIATL